MEKNYWTRRARAVIASSLIKNYGFVDGNKRLGIAVMLLLLQLNQIKVVFNQDELVELGMGVTEGLVDELDIGQWIEKHTKQVTTMR